MDVAEKKWKESEIKNGIMTVSLSSWRHFHDYVVDEMLDFHYYIWRGQRDSSWELISSLDRLLVNKPESDRAELMTSQFEQFQRAVRGRRGLYPPSLKNENEWWALGQHHALATPLLDWTSSPFVALYFAFEKLSTPSSGRRAIWALNEPVHGNSRVKNKGISSTIKGTLDFVAPDQSENPRLLSQAGLFTRGPVGMSVDSWVSQAYESKDEGATLIKIEVPNEGREECLRTLNRMNINHATLFPDLYGAGAYCNKLIELGN